MLPELGNYALILALCLAILQVISPMLMRYTEVSITFPRSMASGQFILVTLSFFILAYAFLSNDFSVAYVAMNSNRHLPAIYRFCALWGAHEGSVLLWIFFLSIWTFAVSMICRHLPAFFLARLLSILGIIAIFFYLFLLLSSNPFIRLLPNFPVDGHDLNPILQDPGLAIHPPMLYMGYVGFSVTYAFAMAALISGQMDTTWARWLRPWTLCAWVFLTMGIILGSAWSYRELGWGGWWFWDPVENASFMPWLVGTALIHSLLVTEKRQLLQRWVLLLAIFAFSLSLLGTFLVRSGILISVHSFASDPRRGIFMLLFLVAIIGISLAVYAWNSQKIKQNNPRFTLYSRESLLIANNALLFTAMLTVLLGTLYPLILDGLHLEKISVGPPYFNKVFIPLMSPLLILMGVAPLLQWQQSRFPILLKKTLTIWLILLIIAIGLPLIASTHLTYGTLLGLILAFWIISHTLTYLLKTTGSSWRLTLQSIPMILAHLGMGVTILGITISLAYSQQRDLSMKPGDRIAVGPYQFELHGVKQIKGPNYNSMQADVAIYKNNHMVHELYPELRFFPVQNTTLQKTAIDAGLWSDLYVALGESIGNNSWGMRIYYKPFVRWIWAGGFMMVLGGMIAVLRYVGAARRRIV